MRCPSNLKNGIDPAYYPRRAAAGAAGALALQARAHPRSHQQEETMAKQPRILAGETAAITGAARGIGRATAEAFLRQGMRVAIGDVDFEAARQTAAELGPSAVALPLDVTDR